MWFAVNVKTIYLNASVSFTLNCSHGKLHGALLMYLINRAIYVDSAAGIYVIIKLPSMKSNYGSYVGIFDNIRDMAGWSPYSVVQR